MIENRYHASGKLLLTSEYLILKGAKGLAVPLNPGQSLTLQPFGREGMLEWTANYRCNPWFKTSIRLSDWKVLESWDDAVSDRLVAMLKVLVEMDKNFFKKIHSKAITTELEFDPAYGFGSSSSLTVLLADFAGLDPMDFHFRISRGSGYDVAAASAERAILYQLVNKAPVIEDLDYQPEFADKLWLVYLGKKQDSSSSVASFLDDYKAKDRDIKAFTHLTYNFIQAKNLAELEEVIKEHEHKLSALLGRPTVQESHFKDFKGFSKSLGAWGGDFALLGSDKEADYIDQYLKGAGFKTWFSYKQLVKTNE